MANQVVKRTYRARIVNHSAVRDDLDSLEFAASKLWNVARWTAGRIWSETGHIPGDGELKAYLKGHERYADLNAQSSQRVIEELAEAFNGWYSHRSNGTTKANPPGYRKHGEHHPRSMVTFKEDGFKHDSEYGRVRLSKGRNLKESWLDFILCEYEVIGSPGTTVANVQQVRAVHEHGEWRLHFVCRVEIDVADSPGERTAGIDLGICNVAAVSFGDEAILYPGGALKEDEYWFAKKRAKRDDPACHESQRLDRKRTARRTHFLHALSKHIVGTCIERGIGTIAVGDLGGIREADDTGEARNWGDHGNLDLHGWAFDRLTSMLEYKAEAEGITVEQVSERDTSKTCSVCGTENGSQRVERGLYDCECGLVANADVNGAENIRQKVLPSLATDGGRDRDNGWLAQPAVYLFEKSTGRITPRERVGGEP